jgi:hypothetical protein
MEKLHQISNNWARQMKISNLTKLCLARSACVSFFALVIFSGYISYGVDVSRNSVGTNHVGEILVPLKAGETSLVSYGLYCVASYSRSSSNAPPGGNLILILRNTGAKWIDLDNVTVENLNLQDSQHRNMKLYLLTPPRDMGFGGATVIHIVVDHPADAVAPWTLRFKSKPKAFVPLDILITGIEPPNATSNKKD